MDTEKAIVDVDPSSQPSSPGLHGHATEGESSTQPGRPISQVTNKGDFDNYVKHHMVGRDLNVSDCSLTQILISVYLGGPR